MKKLIIFALFALLALPSCKKGGERLFRGDYSFKTSGSVTFEQIVPDDDDNEPLSFTDVLSNEIGQLEINALGNEKDSLVVVINTMGGEVIVTHAFSEDNKIYLKEFIKNDVHFSDDLVAVSKRICVQAEGQMYDGNTLILNMVYEGEVDALLSNYRIHGDNIQMVAIRN